MAVSLLGSKILLAVCNFLLLVSGFTLVTGGMIVLFDTDRVLLSKLLSFGAFSTLPHPLLYYLALGITILGLILAAAGVLGCWASCLHSYYMVSIYFVIIMVLLIGECAIYTVGWGWPQCIGLSIEPESLAKQLQKNYGVNGNDQFTAAVDLAQSTFNCCGIDSANEYDTSLWRLQSLGPSLAVPLTCCKLINANSPKSYLNPQPINTSLCQALERNRHEGFRHTDGCKDYLYDWYKEHYVIFLAAGLVVVIIEFIVLLSTILTCTRIYHYNQEAKANSENSLREEAQSTLAKDSFYHKSSPLGAFSNASYSLSAGSMRNDQFKLQKLNN